nr:immunoglobulin heavy chain junction region [Mus musculus]MBK4197840.1 immunoglobulin heavy chain junction region [Mus musculus]MBK4197841.1 immunoglobulin heavy chain junction region [Mus musculus]MBK4197842.1 immunoglobulin heavy chain junction region [Mus musculus]
CTTSTTVVAIYAMDYW